LLLQKNHIQTQLASMLVFLLISFDSTLIKILHAAVALFRHCSCIFLVYTISGAPFQTTLIGGQFSWSCTKKNIGPRYSFDALPFFLFTYIDVVVLELIIGLFNPLLFDIISCFTQKKKGQLLEDVSQLSRPKRWLLQICNYSNTPPRPIL
jgi:hypothetical protein